MKEKLYKLNLRSYDFYRVRNSIVREYWQWYNIVNEADKLPGLTVEQKLKHKESAEGEFHRVNDLLDKINKIMFDYDDNKK